MVALVAYTLILFTDLVPLYEGQDFAGESLASVIAITVCANLIIVTYLTIKMLIND